MTTFLQYIRNRLRESVMDKEHICKSMLVKAKSLDKLQLIEVSRRRGKNKPPHTKAWKV